MRYTHLGIFEALNAWADPVDSVMMLQDIMNRVNAVASRTGCTELSDYQVTEALGLTHAYQLAQLRNKGLIVHRRSGHYVVDTRDFARWVAQECDRLRTLPRHPRPAAPLNSQGTLL